MNKEKFLFVFLLSSILLLEMSFYGLEKTGNSFYIFAVIASTIASTYTAYCLISYLLCTKADTQKDHYFFFLNEHEKQENSFYLGPERRIR